MISNNSCGARSVMYGKTIDHVLELDVILSDGSQVHLRPLNRAELDARARATRSKRVLSDRAAGRARMRRRNREALSESRPPRRRLQPRRIRRRREPFNLAKIIVGPKGRLE
jgi:FAD/FMN-containing dehydrogenase